VYHQNHFVAHLQGISVSRTLELHLKTLIFNTFRKDYIALNIAPLKSTKNELVTITFHAKNHYKHDSCYQVVCYIDFMFLCSFFLKCQNAPNLVL